ncbi:MAG: hypothetical protein LAT84_13150 [Balneolia bacterium]|nr:hypothetical protein [Balneolia bacterium]
MIDLLYDTLLLIVLICAATGFISVFVWSLLFWPYAYFKGKYNGFEKNKKWDPEDDYKKYVKEKEPLRWWLKVMIIILRFSQPIILYSFFIMVVFIVLSLITKQFI